ncbi:BolA/IbaG family iron-sulfur metabolism protein [Beijerinckia mobilis]|uniref:BolA/IbaG family iron-sulfur metabolism protein n=1 Tax=Beijerinckia mobilis TaxID=231434 RepID=UPI0005561DF2|nr:BolA family transcriptional regulator [Beijerinckia mobilis]
MPMEQSEIERLIKEGIPDAKIQITDLAGDKDHYAAIVISSEFTGKTKLQQHQIVYKALGGNMGGQLHALQLTTYAPK